MWLPITLENKESPPHTWSSTLLRFEVRGITMSNQMESFCESPGGIWSAWEGVVYKLTFNTIIRLFPECGPQGSSISTAWELARNANSWSHPLRNGSQIIHGFTGSPGDPNSWESSSSFVGGYPGVMILGMPNLWAKGWETNFLQLDLIFQTLSLLSIWERRGE